MREALHHLLRVGHVHPAEHLHAALAGLGLGRAAVHGQHLGHLLADGQHRVERGHRVLVDHGDLVAAQLAQLFRAAVDQRLPLKDDVALVDLAVAAQVVDQAVGHRALAAAGFAHQPERLAAMNIKRDAAHGVHVALARLVGDAQVIDLNDRFAHSARRSQH